MQHQQDPSTNDWTFTIGHQELVVHRRYEVLSIFNDFLIGIWFVISSTQLLMRSTIRLHRYIYFKQLPDTDHDA